MTSPVTPGLNGDHRRQSLWSATMPALPDRSGGSLPDTADVVVIGGGYTGVNAARELARRGVSVTLVEARTLGFGASTRNGGVVHTGRYFAGLAVAADRAGADLHEATRATAIRRQADGRFVVETERGAILARDVLVATNGYTDGVAPYLRRRIIPIGSYIIASEPLPDDLVRDISPRGRAFFDTKNFLYYWHISADRRMLFCGRASMLSTS